MGRYIHVNGTMYSLRLFNRNVAGPVRNVSRHGLIVKCKMLMLPRGKILTSDTESQPDLGLDSKAGKIFQGWRC